VKLLTKAILERLPKIGETAEENAPVVWVKFFDPFSQWTWYVIEYDGEDLFFGYVEGIEPELGHFTLSELASLTAPHQSSGIGTFIVADCTSSGKTAMQISFAIWQNQRTSRLSGRSNQPRNQILPG